MHFGPTEDERAAAAAQGSKDAQSGGFAGFGKRTGEMNATDAFHANQQAFASAGYSETQHYRRFAEQYRAKIRTQERAWPLTFAILGAVLFGVYRFTQKIQER